MLGLAYIGHTIDSIDDKKKFFYSITLVVMVILAGLSPFIIFSSQKTKADFTPLVYEEDYESDVELPDPSNSGNWYTFYIYNHGGAGGSCNITTDQALSGTQSWNITDDGDATNILVNYNLTTASNYTFLNISCYPTSNHHFLRVRVYDTDDDGVIFFNLGDDVNHNADDVSHRQGSNHPVVGQLTQDSWNNISVEFDYTTNEYNITIIDVASSGWYPFYQGGGGVTQMSYIRFNTGTGGAGEEAEIYLDDFNISHRGGGTPPSYPTIDSTAFINSLYDVDGTPIITFYSSIGGVTVWSNNSGTKNETMNVTINDGDGDVAWINVSLYDFEAGLHDIDAEDITLFASHIPDGAFYEVGGVGNGAFPEGGGNISLNTDTWTWSNDPFPISGDDSIYFRFKLDIDAGQTLDLGYYTDTMCGVWIGG